MGLGLAYDFILGNTIESVWELIAKTELKSVTLSCLIIGLIVKKRCAAWVRTLWWIWTLRLEVLNLMIA